MVDSDHDGFVVDSGHIAGTTVQGKGVPAAGRGRYRQQNGDDENKEESFSHNRSVLVFGGKNSHYFQIRCRSIRTLVTLTYKGIYNLFLHNIQIIKVQYSLRNFRNGKTETQKYKNLVRYRCFEN